MILFLGVAVVILFVGYLAIMYDAIQDYRARRITLGQLLFVGTVFATPTSLIIAICMMKILNYQPL
jgi:hypothetical protein